MFEANIRKQQEEPKIQDSKKSETPKVNVAKEATDPKPLEKQKSFSNIQKQSPITEKEETGQITSENSNTKSSSVLDNNIFR